MCNPETKQSFVVLRAFDRAGKHVYSDELEQEIEKIVREAGYQTLEQIGPLKLSSILNELAVGKMTKPNKERRWTLTESGKTLMNVFRGYVKESSPELAKI